MAARDRMIFMDLARRGPQSRRRPRRTARRVFSAPCPSSASHGRSASLGVGFRSGPGGTGLLQALGLLVEVVVEAASGGALGGRAEHFDAAPPAGGACQPPVAGKQGDV